MELRQENQAVLHDLGYVPGVELAPRRVDFNLVFPTEWSRSEGKSAVTSLGFEWTDCDEAVEPGTFEATAMKTLSPDADNITASEIALIEAITALEATVDGWGFSGDAVH